MALVDETSNKYKIGVAALEKKSATVSHIACGSKIELSWESVMCVVVVGGREPIMV